LIGRHHGDISSLRKGKYLAQKLEVTMRNLEEVVL